MTSSSPIWRPPGRRRTPRRVPARVEVLVVGGGITGVLAMRALRVEGADALLVERRQLAAGASGRNAGFLLSGVAENYAAACRRHGRGVARAVWTCTAESHELLLACLGEAGARLAGHRRRGAWTLAMDGVELEDLRASEVLLAEDALPGRWVDEPPATPLGCRGGLLVETDGEIDPAAAVAVLAAGIDDARVAAGVAVSALETGGGEVRADTSAGEVACGAVVLATNAWIAELAPGCAVTPVRGQMLATRPLPPRASRRPVYARRGHRYWRQLESGELLVGGCRELAEAEEVGTDEITTPAVQAGLDAELGRLGAAGAEVSHRWSGIMGFSADGLPLVGELPGMPNVHVCGGYTGHGMGMAAVCVRILTGAMRGRGAVPDWLSAARAPSATDPGDRCA